jgi:hypothetical protein
VPPGSTVGVDVGRLVPSSGGGGPAGSSTAPTSAAGSSGGAPESGVPTILGPAVGLGLLTLLTGIAGVAILRVRAH